MSKYLKPALAGQSIMNRSYYHGPRTTEAINRGLITEPEEMEDSGVDCDRYKMIIHRGDTGPQIQTFGKGLVSI